MKLIVVEKNEMRGDGRKKKKGRRGQKCLYKSSVEYRARYVRGPPGYKVVPIPRYVRV